MNERKPKSNADSFDPRPGQAGSSSARPAAPEVSQGLWKERAYVPRSVMDSGDIISGLEESLRQARSRQGAAAFRVFLLDAWLPLLQQAVEQFGGDGLDAYLRTLLEGAHVAKDPLLQKLAEAAQVLARAQTVDQGAGAAARMIEVVKEAVPRPRPISLRYLEKSLEGRLEVDAILTMLLADSKEIEERLQHVSKTLESLRVQLQHMPGARPDGMFANFTRLKCERRVLEAELTRRAR